MIRGVPLDASGEFFLPLWTDFGVGGELGILDWYTVPVGVLALLTLTQHGALWVALKTEERGAAPRANGGLRGLVRRGGDDRRGDRPHHARAAAGAGEPRGSSLGLRLPGAGRGRPAGDSGRRARAPDRLMASSAPAPTSSGMLTSAAFGVFPYVLPARPDPASSLTIHNAAAAPTA